MMAIVLPKVGWVKLLSFVVGSVVLTLSIVGGPLAVGVLVSFSVQELRTNNPASINSRAGTNLATAQKVIFNGYALGVNPAYATDNVLIITVHDSVPTIATNPNVKDELTVVTAGG